MEQWLREYRLVAGVRGKKGFELGSDSNGRPLHVSFNLEKSDTQSSNTGKITISNLSDEHKATLAEKDCYIQLSAGYGSNLGLIFAGDVSTTTESLSGADRDFEIEVIDGFASNDLPGWISESGVVTCKTVLDKIIEKMEVESAIITDKANEKLNSAMYDNGYAYVGKLRAALQNVLRKAGCTYSIQNGILQIYCSGEAISTKAYVLSAETGLISIPEKITISDSNSTSGTTSSSSSGTASKGIPGYKVYFFLNPAVGVNDLISLKSRDVSGTFRVHKITLDGDNYSGDWKCEAELVEVT